MSFATCYAKAKKFIKDSGLEKNISGARLEYLAKSLDKIGGDSLTPAEFAAKAQEFIEGDYERENAKRKAAMAQAILTREQAVKSILANKEQWKSDILAGKKDFIFAEGNNDPAKMAVQAVRSWQEGGALRAGEGTNLAVAQAETSIRSRLWRTFHTALGPIENIVASEKPVLDRDALLELGAIDRKTLKGTTNNPQALQYAKALKVFRDSVFAQKQAINPYMESAQDYLWMQMHDRERISDTPKPQWVSDAMKAFGKNSYPELTAPEKEVKFAEAYDKITAGKWGSTLPDGAQAGENLLTRQAASREWHAESDLAFADYNSKYGPKTLYEGMGRIINSAARDIALLNKAGPTPDFTREQVIAQVQRSLSGDELDNFKQARRELDRNWDVVRGAQNAPAQGFQAKAVRAMMTMQWLAKGGMAILHAGPGDVSLSASLLDNLDRSGLAKHAFDITTEFSKSVADSKGNTEAMGKLGLFSRSLAQDLAADLGQSQEPGAASKMAKAIGTLSMYNSYIDRMQGAIGRVVGSMLGDISGTAHADLPDGWKQGLARYGIDQTGWDSIRGAAEDVGGVKMLTPEAIERMDGLSQRDRDSLSLKLAQMINEHATLGSAHADTRQRAFMYGDTTINTWNGQLWRMLYQFKAATMVSSDVARRGILSGSTPGSAYAGLASRMVMGAFFTAIADAAYQFAKGETPEDPTQLSYIAKLALGSGFAGVYGSMMEDAFSDSKGANDKSLSIMKHLLGPVPSLVISTGALAGQAAQELHDQGEVSSKTKSQAMGTALGSAPIGVNSLVWTKAMFDYYIGNQLREFVGPGYLHSLERGAALHGQKYLWATPSGDPGILRGGQ